jgi:hypothetical protein
MDDCKKYVFLMKFYWLGRKYLVVWELNEILLAG